MAFRAEATIVGEINARRQREQTTPSDTTPVADTRAEIVDRKELAALTRDKFRKRFNAISQTYVEVAYY